MSLQLWYIINFNNWAKSKNIETCKNIIFKRKYLGKYWGAPSDGELENSKENKNCSYLQIADMSRISGSLTQAWLSVLIDKSSTEHT